jgi:hypothetical protein
LKFKGIITFSSKGSLRLFKAGRLFSKVSFLGAVITAFIFALHPAKKDFEVLAEAWPFLFFLAVWILLRSVSRRRIKLSMAGEAERLGLTLKQYKTKMRKEKKSTLLVVSSSSDQDSSKPRSGKHKWVQFRSAGQRRVFRLLRVAGLVLLSTGGIPTAFIMKQLFEGSLVHPGPLLATAVIAVIGISLIAASELLIRPMLQEQAAQAGISVREFIKAGRKGHRNEQNEDLRRQKALDLHWYRLRLAMEDVQRVYKSGINPEWSAKELADEQNKGQTIVDRTSRQYAVSEYAIRHGAGSPSNVEDLLRKEGGGGPVTKAVERLVESVHYEYKAYFEHPEHSFKGAWKGYEDYEGVGGNKKRAYRD